MRVIEVKRLIEDENENEGGEHLDRFGRYVWGEEDIRFADPHSTLRSRHIQVFDPKARHLVEESTHGREYLPDTLHHLDGNSEAFRRHEETFEPHHVEAIKNYVASSLINRGLRQPDRWTHTPEQKKLIEHLDHVTSSTLTHPVTVYRGFDHHHAPSNLPVGSEFSDHGFVSTTHNPQVAGMFIPSASPIKHIAQIHVPAGMRGYHLDRAEGLDQEEGEFLLPRGTRFRVVGHERGLSKISADEMLEDPRPIHVTHLEVIGHADHGRVTDGNKFRWDEGSFTHYPAAAKLSEETADLPQFTDHTENESGYAKHAESFGPKHYAAIRQYKNSSWEFTDPMRRGVVNPLSAMHIKNLSHVTSHEITNPVTVYRGFGYHDAVADLKPGDVIHDKAFVSTTHLKNIAMEFTQVHKGSGMRHLAVIHAPAGTKGFYLDRAAHEASNSHEREFLLHPGTHFRVTKVTDGEHRDDEHSPVQKVRYIHMTVEKQDGYKLPVNEDAAVTTTSSNATVDKPLFKEPVRRKKKEELEAEIRGKVINEASARMVKVVNRVRRGGQLVQRRKKVSAKKGWTYDRIQRRLVIIDAMERMTRSRASRISVPKRKAKRALAKVKRERSMKMRIALGFQAAKRRGKR